MFACARARACVCGGGYFTKDGQRMVTCFLSEKKRALRASPAEGIRCRSPRSRSRALGRQSWAAEAEAEDSEGPEAWRQAASPSGPLRGPRFSSASCPLAWGRGSRNRNSCKPQFQLLPKAKELCGDERESRGSGARMQISLILHSSTTSGPISVTGKLVKTTQSQLS